MPSRQGSAARLATGRRIACCPYGTGCCQGAARTCQIDTPFYLTYSPDPRPGERSASCRRRGITQKLSGIKDRSGVASASNVRAAETLESGTLAR